MAIEFDLPEVAEGVETADIAEIHVAEGDVIEAGQVVLEVETEKAVADIECPHAGKVVKIHVQEGDSVQIGATLLSIEQSEDAESSESEGDGDDSQQSSDGESAEKSADEDEQQDETEKSQGDDDSEKSEKKASRRQDDESEKSKSDEKSSDKADSDSGESQREAVEQPSADAPAQAGRGLVRAARPEGENGPPPPAGPSTRRLARQLGVDLHGVEGSGPGGRITAEDVQKYVRGLTATKVHEVSSPTTGMAQLPDFNKYGVIERKRMSKLARTSAANLSLSWQQIPHVTQHDLVDITELEASRRKFVEVLKKKGGPKVTMTAVIIKAAVAALKAFPHVNASLDTQTDELVLKRYYHIGVAVDTEAGLVVPVIRDADQKTILEIAEDLTELAGRARDRKLNMDDMQGGTFTITNLGGIGGTSFTPIVNYPEVAILGMSRTQPQIRLIDGEVQERLMLPLSLSYDHRVVNGADAARFITRIHDSLSDSFQLMVDC